jgi:MFS family permease
MVRLPVSVILLGFTSLLTDAGSEMIFPLLPLFLTGTLGASPAFLGFVEGAADVVASLLKLIAGRLSDRLGARKPLILAGYGLAGAVRPLVSFATAPWHVLLVRITDRVGKGVRGAPRDALIADVTPEGLGSRAFGFHRAMDDAGAVFGPLIAAALLAAGVGLRSIFLLASIPGILALLTVALVRERRPAAAPVVTSMPEAPTPAAPLPRVFWKLLFVFGLFGLGNSSDAFLLLRAKGLGVPEAIIPLLWSYFHVCKVIWAGIGGWLGDRVEKRYVIVAGWAIYGLSYLLFAYSTAAWQVWLVFTLYGGFFGLGDPVQKALVRDIVPAGARGHAFGWYNLITGIMALPASFLIGAVWERMGPVQAFSVGASLALAAALWMLWLRPVSAR